MREGCSGAQAEKACRRRVLEGRLGSVAVAMGVLVERLDTCCRTEVEGGAVVSPGVRGATRVDFHATDGIFGHGVTQRLSGQELCVQRENQKVTGWNRKSETVGLRGTRGPRQGDSANLSRALDKYKIIG